MKVKSDAAESVKDLLCSRNLIRHSSGLHFVWRGNPSLSTTSRQVFKPWAEPQPSRCCHCCFHLWSSGPGTTSPNRKGQVLYVWTWMERTHRKQHLVTVMKGTEGGVTDPSVAQRQLVPQTRTGTGSDHLWSLRGMDSALTAEQCSVQDRREYHRWCGARIMPQRS